MRDFSVAIGLVLAIEGLLMAGLTSSMRTRMAIAGREDRRNRAELVSALRGWAWGSSGLPAHFSGDVTSRRIDGRR